MTKASRSYIEICYTCNSNCISCPCPAAWQKQGILPFERLKEYFDEHTGEGSVVNINGGEPTVHPDFVKVIDYAAKKGVHVGILSNGRRFSDKKFAEASVKAGLKDICIAFHSSDKKTYEQFTRAEGSFEETVSGIKNICQLKSDGYSINFCLKILICKSTIKHLTDTVRFASREFSSPDSIMLEAMDIVCSALENRDKTLITLTEAAPYIARAVRIGLAGGQNMRLHYLPPCFFPNPEFYYNWVQLDLKGTQNILGPHRYMENLPVNGAGVKASLCAECDAGEFCSGVWRSYQEVVGLDELKPVKNLKIPAWLRK